MKRVAVLLLAMLGLGFISFIYFNSGSKPDTPLAKGGTLDVRDWGFHEHKTIPLNGEWEFYAGKLLSPEDFREKEMAEGAQLVPVPGIWSQYVRDGQRLSDQGYATYRLVVRFSEEERGSVKSLYISNVATAYKLWVNGKLVAANGIVGKSKEEMLPKNYAKIANVNLQSTEAELVMQVSNFVQRKGGLWTSIELGDYEAIGFQRDYRVAEAAALSACLFTTGLYHWLLFSLRRKDVFMLYFGTFCILITLRTLFLGETLAVRMIPSLPWELGVKIEYLALAIGVPMLAAFVQALYPSEMNVKHRNFIALIGGAYSLFVIVTPAAVYTQTMLAFQVFILLSFIYIVGVYAVAVRRKRKWSLLNLLACIIGVAAGLNDMFYYNHLVPNGELFPMGLLLAIFILAFMLSARSSHSFMQVEQLSYELTRLNDSLESKIEARTTALQTANRELQKANVELAGMEQSRRRLMSSISHELGTPLTSIKGYMEAMMEGVIRPDDLKYVRLIYNKSLHLERMIGDLFELSRLEARQIRFEFQPVTIETFIYELYEKYELDIQTSGIRVEWKAEPCPFPEGPAIARIDPVRLEQVYTNFLINAIKFTPEGGTIQVGIRWSAADPEDHLHAVVYVSDTGSGIQEKDLPYIFDRFYKGETPDKPFVPGSGLGLAISKEIIEAHQGHIGAESRSGGGSTFTVSLPVSRPSSPK